MAVESEERSTLARAARWVAWLLAASFLIATVLFFLLAYDVTAPPPRDVAGNDFVAQSVADFQNEQERWPQELSATLLFGLGFLLLVPLALTVRQSFGRGRLVATVAGSSLAVAGIIGAVTQLAFIGAKEVAIDPRYCQCEYAPEQIISQNRALAIASGTQRWMSIGVLFLIGVGLFLFAQAAREEPRFGGGWRWLALAGAVVSLAGVIAAGVQVDLLFELVVALGAGILLPVWAILSARRIGRTAT
jgi:hypothetical protein